jgi:hypothetical protein
MGGGSSPAPSRVLIRVLNKGDTRYKKYKLQASKYMYETVQQDSNVLNGHRRPNQHSIYSDAVQVNSHRSPYYIQ